MDIVKASGVGVPITLSGKTYTLSPLRLRHLAEFTAWAQAHLKNPIEKVMEALDSPAGQRRDAWAAAKVREFREAERAAADEQARATRENRTPDPALAVDPALAADALLATEWQDERRAMMLRSYADAIGPGPQFSDPILAPLVQSVEGRAFELWLSLRQKHAAEFRDHWDVLDLVNDNLEELVAAHQRLARLNDPDPEKNGQGRPADQAAPATVPANP